MSITPEMEGGYPSLAGLRTPGLTGDNWETAEAYCPVCGCMKSGDVDTPNPSHDGCDDYGCRCHLVDQP